MVRSLQDLQQALELDPNQAGDGAQKVEVITAARNEPTFNFYLFE